MKTVYFVAALSALSACVPATPEVTPGTPFKLSAANISAIKRDVRAAMKDPDSARFGAMSAAQDKDGVVTVCGYVNGRNSFGGYVGEKPFIGVLTAQNTRFYVVDIAGDDADVRSTIVVCRRNGVAI